MATVSNINLSLYPEHLERLDALVEVAKKRSPNPKAVNRATLLREMIDAAYIAKREEGEIE